MDVTPGPLVVVSQKNVFHEGDRMKKSILLSTILCYFMATAAFAADAPGITPSAPLASKVSGSEAAKPKAYTIEELYKNIEKLSKEKVVVHGQVVKTTSGIMGKIWTHIQDGTGDKTKRTNDLICISSTAQPEVGDEVTFVGTVNYTPNTRYSLTLEDATILK
jgi:hypothetical protein